MKQAACRTSGRIDAHGNRDPRSALYCALLTVPASVLSPALSSKPANALGSTAVRTIIGSSRPRIAISVRVSASAATLAVTKYLFRNDGLAIKRLRHVLKPRRHVDGIAECREDRVILEADVADDDVAAMNTEAVLDRFGQIGRELAVHVVNIGRDVRGRLQGLAACSCRV